ncbi:hypothetical protein CWI37_0601p0020 [Hamiltosporidium tvaerminnensis]|uniref:Uncharacterized protein n=1 Tax=Hamiltosporidium tvaerminnensis TaxID=1176355 RepID=A0A4Q9L5N7_9MICR|nr:hypothetical protein CWI37_0601p0020 [Hamiltosporidium tvaerminnensis]
MFLNFDLKNIEKSCLKNTDNWILILVIYFLLSVNSTTVSFFVINEENCISNLLVSDLTLEMIFFSNKSVEWITNEGKITIFKNNIVRYESTNTETKYYNPSILAIPYKNNMLLNSKYIKNKFELEKANIRIFFKDVSYSSLLLFLKLVNEPDYIVNQIKIEAFMDILIILSILDIDSSKERNIFLKYVFLNVIYGMQNINSISTIEQYCANFQGNIVKKSVCIDLFVFLIGIITFNDKTAQQFIVFSEKTNLAFKYVDLYSDTYSIIKKNENDKLFLRLDDFSIDKLCKIARIDYLLKSYGLLFKITKLDLLYIIFQKEDTYTKAFALLSDINFKTEKLYVHSIRNTMKLFFWKNFNQLTNELKVLKLRSSFKAEELIKMLDQCVKIKKITLYTNKMNVEILSIMINFSSKNPSVSFKVFCLIFGFLDMNFSIFESITDNICVYIHIIKLGSEIIKIPTELLPFLHKYKLEYEYSENFKPFMCIVLLECSRFKYFDFDYSKHSSPFKLEDSFFTPLRYLDTMKYFSLENIIINDELLMFVLESATIKTLEITNFVCNYDFKHFLKNKTLNHNLRSISLTHSLSKVDSNLILCIERFYGISHLKLQNIDWISSKTKSFHEYIFRLVSYKDNKIYLKCLEIDEALNNNKMFNNLLFLSETYGYTNIKKIEYRVYEISEIEYSFFNQMTKLENIFIEVRNTTASINFKKLFCNIELFNTIILISIHVNRIFKEDTGIFKKFKFLAILYFEFKILDFDTISNIKKRDFKNIQIHISPNRAERSVEINNYLDSEFKINFS